MNKNKINSIFTFWILPAFIGVMCLVLRWASGPFWLGTNSDPAYVYLFNSLYLFDGMTPVHTDHPGTPLQILGAGIIGLLNPGVERMKLLEAVFTQPEIYLHAIYGMLWLLFICSHVCLVRYIWKTSQSLITTLAFQLPALLWLTTKSRGTSEYVLPVVANVNAETLMLTVLNIFLIAMWRLYSRYEHTSLRQAIVLGIICGFGLSVKLTFLSLALIPALLLPRFRLKGLYGLSVLASFVFSTMPIWELYGNIFGWIMSIFSLSASHTSGESLLGKLSIFVTGFRALLPVYWPLFLLTVAGFGLAIFYLIKTKRAEEGRKAAIFLAVFCGAIVIHFFMISPRPSYQYLTSILALVGWIIYLMGVLIGHRYRRWSSAMILVLVIAFCAQSIVYAYRLGEIGRGSVDFYHHVQKEYKDFVVVSYYRSSSPYYALEFGDNYLNANKYGPDLKRMFPQKYFYNVWQRTFTGFDKNKFVQSIMPANGCLLMTGSQGGLDQHKPILQLEELESRHGEAVYRVKQSTHDQAHYYFLMAQKFQNEGEYEKARMLAEASLALGIPRAQKLLEGLLPQKD